MPFLSKAQQGFAYANPGKFGGKKKLAEWSVATDFKHLPRRKAKAKRKATGGASRILGRRKKEYARRSSSR